MTNINLIRLALIGVALLAASSAAQEPAPSEPSDEPPFRVELKPTGYHVLLSRTATEKVSELLDQVEGEETLAEALRTAKDLTDEPKARLELSLIAHAIDNDLPRFKKELKEKIGENGIIIKVIGYEQKPKKEPPLLKRIKKRLPPLLQEKARIAVKMARTVPLSWSIEGR